MVPFAKTAPNGSSMASGTIFFNLCLPFACRKRYHSVKWYQYSPFFEMELKWLLLSKWSHNQPFFVENGTTLQSGAKMVPERGPSCGHENGYTFFFQCIIYFAHCRGTCIKEESESDSRHKGRRFRLKNLSLQKGVCVFEKSIFVDGATFLYERHPW